MKKYLNNILFALLLFPILYYNVKEENLTKKDIIELEKMIEQYEENMDD